MGAQELTEKIPNTFERESQIIEKQLFQYSRCKIKYIGNVIKNFTPELPC